MAGTCCFRMYAYFVYAEMCCGCLPTPLALTLALPPLSLVIFRDVRPWTLCSLVLLCASRLLVLWWAWFVSSFIPFLKGLVRVEPQRQPGKMQELLYFGSKYC